MCEMHSRLHDIQLIYDALPHWGHLLKQRYRSVPDPARLDHILVLSLQFFSSRSHRNIFSRRYSNGHVILPCDLPLSSNFLWLFLWLSHCKNIGVLPVVTQGYLICTSVLLVWQLSRFDEYTSFSLLLALAFYDLCAVLSPCGPLKALVALMQERNIPLPVNSPS